MGKFLLAWLIAVVGGTALGLAADYVFGGWFLGVIVSGVSSALIGGYVAERLENG